MNTVDNQKDINFNKLNFLLKKLSLEFPVADLSRKTKYSQATISPYLSGKIKPSTKFLQSIMKNFEINLDGFENEYKQDGSLDSTSEEAADYGLNESGKKELKGKENPSPKGGENDSVVVSRLTKMLEDAYDEIKVLRQQLERKKNS